MRVYVHPAVALSVRICLFSVQLIFAKVLRTRAFLSSARSLFRLSHPVVWYAGVRYIYVDEYIIKRERVHALADDADDDDDDVLPGHAQREVYTAYDVIPRADDCIWPHIHLPSLSLSVSDELP